MLKKIKAFFEDGIWTGVEGQTGIVKMLFRSLQVLFIAGRDYVEDKCAIRGAALTFYSALSLVPILALLFGIAKGFGFETHLKQKILESTSQNQEVLMKMFSFAENTLMNARGGVVAGVGIILLLYTVLRTIGLVENAFNDIWQVKQARSWLRKFTDYLSLTLIAPVLLIFSGSVTVFISTNIRALAETTGTDKLVAPALNLGLSFAPYIIIWVLFLGIYMIMPNKKVKFIPALIAAVVAGSVYQVVEWVYITFQVGVSNYNGIYGSFAALPLFLVWVQTSWTIVLFGAELSYAIQNLNELVRTHKKKNLNAYQQLKYGIMVLQCLLNHTTDDDPLISADRISEELDMGLDRVVNVLYNLEQAHLVVSVEKEEDTQYQSLRDSRDLNVLFVMEALAGKPSDADKVHVESEELIALLKADLAKSEGNIFLRRN